MDGKTSMKTKHVTDKTNTHSVGNFIHFMIQEVVTPIKMLIPKHTLTYNLIWYLPFHVHHKFQHLVVRCTLEQDLSCIQFVDCTTDREHVYRMVVSIAKDCKIEHTHDINLLRTTLLQR